MPPGHNVQVQMQTGTIFNGGGFPFSYTCPASSDTSGTHSADAHPGGPGGSGTYYTGACEGVSLSGDFAVTAGG
jgi:hypothetical protein